jgi:hypothetical protein
VFRNLPAGRFEAAIRANGYVNELTARQQLIDITDTRTPIEIQLRVWKYGALGGRIFDERGEPLSGIPVTALQRVPVAGGVLVRRVEDGLTDDRGEYRLTKLPPGEYIVGVLRAPVTLPESIAAALDPSPANRTRATAVRRTMGFLLPTSGCPTCIGSPHEGQHINGLVLQHGGAPLPPAPDGRPLGFANTYSPSTTGPEEATAVSLGSGDARGGLDITVRLVPTVSVSGRLTGPEGPLPHVALALASQGTDVHNVPQTGVATAVSTATGTFTFLGVTPGEYDLTVAWGKDVDIGAGTGQPFWASERVSIGDAGVEDLEIVMRPGVRVSGRAEFKGLTTPPQLPQRHVMNLQPVRAIAWSTLQGVVQPTGTFRTGGDPPGRYLINASSPPGWFWQSTLLNGKPVLDEVIDVGSEEVTGLVLTYGRASNRVSGLVTGSNGGPEASAAVIAFPADSGAWREGIFSSRRERRVHATSAGAYDIERLAPGTYYLAAVSMQHALDWQNPRFLERLIRGAVTVTLTEEDQKTVALRIIEPEGTGQ